MPWCWTDADLDAVVVLWVGATFGILTDAAGAGALSGVTAAASRDDAFVGVSTKAYGAEACNASDAEG